ncbi:MAG: 1-phosphofructokinase, partial [Eubacterium sp.]|nr:1-phosphofructokinase [Eubacterium sp.]
MVITVTVNPSLDYFVSMKQFRLGATNRTTSELLLPGGKGINVSTVLTTLGIPNTAVFFSAGFVGEEITRLLSVSGIRTMPIRVAEGCSRLNLKLRTEEDVVEGTELNGMGPQIPDDKLEEMMRYLSGLAEGDTLVLGGTVPGTLPATIYRDILE